MFLVSFGDELSAKWRSYLKLVIQETSAAETEGSALTQNT